MGLLSTDELHPLQEARRVAEEHLETIRQIALARLGNMPRVYGNDEHFVRDNNRYHKIAEVVGALQTIYDNVSELEFEDDEPVTAEPPEPEPDEDEELDDDEDEEEDEDDDDDE